MGMTIEESIEIIEPTINIGASKIDCALEIATETMCKYQKIKKIIDDWENSGEEDDPMNIIDNIEEVLEDGKIG